MIGGKMSQTKLTIFLVLLLFAAGCCNALKPSKGIKIPPYIIDYYHYEDPSNPSLEEEQSKGWYEHVWGGDKFKMSFKLSRVEGSGVYFYKLLYRANNLTDQKVKLLDQNIDLVDINTGVTIQRIQCWNWQRQNLSVPCHVVEIGPKRAVAKEIRFDYSTDENFASGLSIKVHGLSFKKGETMIDFYAKPRN